MNFKDDGPYRIAVVCQAKEDFHFLMGELGLSYSMRDGNSAKSGNLIFVRVSSEINSRGQSFVGIIRTAYLCEEAENALRLALR